MNNLENFQLERLDADLFLIQNGEESIAFSPLRRKYFSVSKFGVLALKDYYLRGIRNSSVSSFLEKNGLLSPVEMEQPDFKKLYKPESLTLALTSGCNLRCIYCYATAGVNSKIMKYDIARAAVDIVAKNAQDSGLKILKITYHGGGETLVVWSLMKKISEYAESIWSKKIKYSIVTNGTLINPVIVDWMKKRQFNVLVSIDGPKKIQDKQRPKADGTGSFTDCLRGIGLLKRGNIPCAIRATVTQENIQYLKAIVDIAAQTNSNLKLEPVTLTGKGLYNVTPILADEFVANYIEALDYAKCLHVKVISSYDNIGVKQDFCAGNGQMFCVLPEGDITSCSRVTRKDDLLANLFLIGKISEGQIQINQEKVNFLRGLTISNFSQCEDCFARWSCSGGCYHTRLSNEGRLPVEDCSIVKQILWYRLKQNIEERR